MKILIAVDSFKGSIDTLGAAGAIARGIRSVSPDAEIIEVPIADGGEGTVSAVVGGMGGELRKCSVTGPLGEERSAEYGILPDGTAVIEMAQASGLPLVPENLRNPLVTTSYGTGQLISSALDNGCRKVIIGIGGSATNDGGFGMAQALGASFRDESGKELGPGGGQLEFLHSIDISGLDKRLSSCEIIVACDVTNPLCGENGASAVYGPQKGATPEMVKRLDANLEHYAKLISTQLGKGIKDIPGAGAAGGLGAGLMAFCNAKIKPGIEIVMELTSLEEKMEGADLVITGEGRIDGSSAFGKAPSGVAGIAKRKKIPVAALCGGVGPGAEAIYEYGVDAIVPIVNKPMPLQEAMDNAETLLAEAAERIMRIYAMGRDAR